MKRITLVLAVTLIISCNFQSEKENKISKEKVVENIQVLRLAGFFETYKNFSNEEIYDTIYANRKKRFTEIFESEYDPGMDLDAIQLAECDKTKMLFLDLEADVIKGNNIYVELIKTFSVLSNNVFKPENIKEKWESETGPIEVSFKSDGSIIKFQPEYQDDWLHESVFEVCNKEFKRKNIRITNCLSDDGNGYGQVVAIMRLTKKEQLFLENNFNWKFTSE